MGGTTLETWEDNIMSVFGRNRMGGLDFYVRLMIRVSGGFYCTQ